MHIFLWYANDLALLNDLGIFPHDGLNVLKVFHGDLQLLAIEASNNELGHGTYQRLYAI